MVAIGRESWTSLLHADGEQRGGIAKREGIYEGSRQIATITHTPASEFAWVSRPVYALSRYVCVIFVYDCTGGKTCS